MESEIWRDGYQLTSKAERTGRRESASQTDVCRVEFGTSGLKGHCSKKTIEPDARRDLVSYAIQNHGLSERQACGMLNLSRSVYRYQAKKGGDEEITKALLELADRKPRWGFGKMQDYLRNEAHGWNHKRIRRVYCDLHLNLRVKPKKRLPRRIPQPLIQPE